MKSPREAEDPLLRRAIPADDPLCRFFWTSGEDGTLRLLHCSRCGLFVHPPSMPCPRCLSTRLQPHPVSGLGVVHTFTVNVQPWVPGQQPYVIAVVELVEQEGLRLTTNIVGSQLGDVGVGSRVTVLFVHRNGLWYPVFELAGDR